MSETPSKSSKMIEKERKRKPQELSKTLQESSKYAPGAPKKVLRCFKDTPKPSKELPRPPEEAPKRFKETQQRPKDTQEQRKGTHTDVPSAPKRIQEVPECCSHVILLSDSQTLILLSSHAIVFSCCDAVIRLQIISQRAIACSLLSKCRPH